jgi:SAM-dependent methyltransferase
MIVLARAQEQARPLGIEYEVGDGRNLELATQPDIVAAAYLLNYARDRSELVAMCESIARCLRPGGRFITVNQNPALDFRAAPSYRPYGFETRAEGEWREATPITWTFYLEDGPFSIENYHLEVATREDALRAAGFRQIRWHPPRLSPEGETAFGREFWKDFLEHSPITFLECTT